MLAEAQINIAMDFAASFIWMLPIQALHIIKNI